MSSEGQFKSPLARARGLGAAHEGSGHWFAQRVTALSNLFLMGWLAWAAATIGDWSYGGFTGWLASPLHAVPFILTVLSVCYHAALGTQVIAEDYVHGEGKKLLTIIFLRFYFGGAAVACVFAILKVAFMARA